MNSICLALFTTCGMDAVYNGIAIAVAVLILAVIFVDLP